MCPYICWFTKEESYIHTVLKSLASSPGSPIFSKYSMECFKGAIKCQQKSSISTVGGSTGCITVTTPQCIINKLKQSSVSINYFQISGLVYTVELSAKELATNPPLATYPCGINPTPRDYTYTSTSRTPKQQGNLLLWPGSQHYSQFCLRLNMRDCVRA